MSYHSPNFKIGDVLQEKTDDGATKFTQYMR